MTITVDGERRESSAFCFIDGEYAVSGSPRNGRQETKKRKKRTGKICDLLPLVLLLRSFELLVQRVAQEHPIGHLSIRRLPRVPNLQFIRHRLKENDVGRGGEQSEKLLVCALARGSVESAFAAEEGGEEGCAEGGGGGVGGRGEEGKEGGGDGVEERLLAARELAVVLREGGGRSGQLFLTQGEEAEEGTHHKVASSR